MIFNKKNKLSGSKNINWFFCLNDNADTLKEASKVAVLSAQEFKINKFCIYAGNDQEYVDFLVDKNVKVIRHTSFLIDDIIKNASSKNEESIWAGAFLRIDIPKIIQDQKLFDDDYYLYTDCDVIFQKDPQKDLLKIKPEYFSASSQTEKRIIDHFNSGIMWCNVKKMASSFAAFKNFIVESNFKFNACDQGALNAFYKGQWDFLDFSFNWKPYWGINKSAHIIHFHGPKPRYYIAHKNNLEKVIKPYLPMLNPRTLKWYEFYVDNYSIILENKRRLDIRSKSLSEMFFSTIKYLGIGPRNKI